MTTKTAQFTPGPWRVIDDVQHDSEESYPVRRLVGQRQCIHAIGQPWLDENIAIIESGVDEYLLTAAPAMYSELSASTNLLCRVLPYVPDAVAKELVKQRQINMQVLSQAEGRHHE